MNRYEYQLEELFKKDPSVIISAQRTIFERLISGIGERYILFGAGRLGQITLAGLRKAGIEPLAFADNNSKLWGEHIKGLRVFSPREAIKKYGSNALFVVCVYTCVPVWQQLQNESLKISSFSLLAWFYPQSLMPHGAIEYPNKIFTQMDDVRSALHLLADDISRQEFLSQLLWRLTLNHTVLPPHLPQSDIYFPNDIFKLSRREVYVDCGAYNGDSIGNFIQRRVDTFKEIVAIEPDPINLDALRIKLTTMSTRLASRIKLIQSAIGENKEKIIFNATGTAASALGKGNYIVQCNSLDELLINIKPTFIKMDIEGAEIDALHGARNIIKREKPIMAICAYHSQEHLWRIPLLIDSYCKDYKFFIRRYSDECWELVCYAVPIDRIL